MLLCEDLKFLVEVTFFADLVNLFKPALVVDPVMVSTSGDVLAGPSILNVFRYVILDQ